MVHEKEIEIRWRDCDNFGHVNNAVYATYLEEARDEWLERALGPTADLWDYVLARVAIDFRRELKPPDEVVAVSVELVSIGRSSLRLREVIRTKHGELSAEAESVIVARDRERGGSRPLTDDERASFTAALSVPAS